MMAVEDTVKGASGGHGRSPLQGERLHDGGGATAGAVVAPRQVQGHDRLVDALWRVGRVALGALSSFLGPGGMRRIVATPPRVAPTF